ncbi:diaminopimelate decarboxylase [Fundidesulfovibrio soli]|uniref:diaminopimelate decarboxylase n=1 Tax=Fundidesulfovibrio soli TaxID=2922716 RepID=UPI001FAF21B4|nr:diaminopimelate decarboxylase [Fundidesulfovibrio soli]
MPAAPFERASALLRAALEQGALDREDTAVLLYDLDALDARLQELDLAFPASTLHAVAVKAAPFPWLLDRLADAGAGLEAASLPELRIALASGCPPERVVFDSPAKTVAEISEALELGVGLNADNFQELERLDALLAGAKPRGPVGLRVNPQVGQGAIEATSVAGHYSKFGEPIEKRAEIVKAYADRPWLRALHLHVGSQGCPLELMASGVRAVLDLRAEIEAACGPGRIRRFDIGGGLPATYRPDNPAPGFADYAALLRQRCPELFTGEMELVTEFGRAVFAGAGLAASRVEYVKRQPGHRTAVIHLGADMFLRPCYAPETWHHEVAAANPDGSLKSGPVEDWHVAGPLCFSGDFPARAAPLAEVAPGDFILIRDAGAYTLGMWSRYNSRQIPKVVGVEGGRARVLKERETPEKVVTFWS